MKDQDDRPAAPVNPGTPDERDESPRPDNKIVEHYREWAEAEREEARRLERYQKRSSTSTEVPRGTDQGNPPTDKK
jgi:hypothetical protein